MRARLRSELGLKLVLMIVLNVWVCLPYYLLQRHHLSVPTEMRASFLDDLIPFQDKAVWIYLSVYLLMPIGPFLMNQRQQIVQYAKGIILIGLIADLVFIVRPTVCPRPEALNTVAAYRMLTTVDNSFHAFPSLHAAFAVYSALCAGLVLREMAASAVVRRGIWFWAILILLAALTTKQHVLLDIVAGSALGFGVYFCVFLHRKFVTVETPFQTVTSNSTQPKSTAL
jgi:membrane-associated phospholipid phosphatase